MGPAAAVAAGRPGEPRCLRAQAQTFRYWAQQLGIGYGAIALGSYLLLLVLMLVSLGHWVWFPFWLGIGAVFAVERW